MNRIIIIFLLLIPLELIAQNDSIDIVLFGHYERLNVKVFHKNSQIKEIKFRKNTVRPSLFIRYSIPKHSKSIHVHVPLDNEMIEKDTIMLTFIYKKPFGLKYKSKTISTELQLEKKYLLIFRSPKCKKYCFVPEWTEEIPRWQ